MAGGHGEFDVPHALTAHAGERHFHAATVADDAAMLDAFILATGTFQVLDRTENAFAIQAALFGLERTVVDGFGILDFPFRPGTNGIRGGDGDRHVIHLIDLVQAKQLACAFFGVEHKFLSIVLNKVSPVKWLPTPWRFVPDVPPDWRSQPLHPDRAIAFP